MEKQAKEIFQIKFSKSEEQKYLVARIQRVTVKAKRDTKCRRIDGQL